MDLSSLPRLGAGIGLRRQFAPEIPHIDRQLDWLEFTPENYMSYGGRQLRLLDAARERFRLVAHGVALNLGGTRPLDQQYLRHLKEIIERVDSPWFSDHLCWTSIPGLTLHELLPMPFTREAVDHVVRRIDTVRRYIDRPFLIENISYYAQLPGAELVETDFINEVLEQADCGMLLDVNNVYVNSRNHAFDPYAYLERLPLERVVQIHMAGHDDSEAVLLDTHGAPICHDVWKLYEFVIKRVGYTSVLIERDQNIPPLDALLDEADRARAAFPTDAAGKREDFPTDAAERGLAGQPTQAKPGSSGPRGDGA